MQSLGRGTTRCVLHFHVGFEELLFAEHYLARVLEYLNVLLDFEYLLLFFLNVFLNLPLLLFQSLLVLLHEMYLEKVVFLQICQVLEKLLRTSEVDVHVGIFIKDDELVLMLLCVDTTIFKSEGGVIKLLIVFVDLIHTFLSFEIDCALLSVD